MHKKWVYKIKLYDVQLKTAGVWNFKMRLIIKKLYLIDDIEVVNDIKLFY